MGMLLPSRRVLIRRMVPPPALLREALTRYPKALGIWAVPSAPAAGSSVGRDSRKGLREGLVPSTLLICKMGVMIQVLPAFQRQKSGFRNIFYKLRLQGPTKLSLTPLPSGHCPAPVMWSPRTPVLRAGLAHSCEVSSKQDSLAWVSIFSL